MDARVDQLISSICTDCGAPIHIAAGALQVRCDHCGGGLAVGEGDRLVRLLCPRCGGNFCYIDGSMCGHCPYCETSLLALTRERLLRYVVPPRLGGPPAAATPGSATLQLLPFWHLGGLVYGWDVGASVEIEPDRRPAGKESEQLHGGKQALGCPVRRDSGPMKIFRGRVLDLALPDPAALALGVTSLRLRAAVFPLEPFAAEHETLGRVLAPVLEPGSVREQLYGRALGLGRPGDGLTRLYSQRSEIVAEELALYYYPFWVEPGEAGRAAALWDAVTGEPEPLTQPAEPASAAGGAAFDELLLIELSCSQCGAALEAGNRPVVLPCRGCGSFFGVGRAGLEPCEARFARPRIAWRSVTWLPFWRVRCELRYGGRRAQRAVDLRTILGVMVPPSPLPVAPAGSPLCYFVPAYGALRAPRVDHAARDLTRAQPLLEGGPTPRGEIGHCFLGAKDARRLAYVTWMTILPGVAPTRMRSLRIETSQCELWYLPFERRGREIINLLTGARYDQAALRGLCH